MRAAFERVLDQEDSGPLRTWAYRNKLLLEGDFYTSDELIDMSRDRGFAVLDPFQRIRYGTEIGPEVVIGQGTSILGKRVRLKRGVHVEGATILGNDISIGEGSKVRGTIEVGGIEIGRGNVIDTIYGQNEGRRDHDRRRQPNPKG